MKASQTQPIWLQTIPADAVGDLYSATIHQYLSVVLWQATAAGMVCWGLTELLFLFLFQDEEKTKCRLPPDVMLDPAVVILQGFRKCLSQINSFSWLNLLMSLGLRTWASFSQGTMASGSGLRGGFRQAHARQHVLFQCFNIPLGSYTQKKIPRKSFYLLVWILHEQYLLRNSLRKD